jgi:hypothetical protein
MFSQLGFQIGGGGEADALASLQNAISGAAAQTNPNPNSGPVTSGGRGRRGRRGRGKRSRRRISGGSGIEEGVTAHDQTGSMSPFSFSGGRRRRRTLRRARRGSRVRRHKSRKENLFGGSKEEEEEEEEEEEGSESENQDGGRRRRRGKKTRGKTSSWIKHVMRFAKDNKMKYFQALKDKRCRSTYKSNKK